jgi:hypothetical protein
MDPAGLCRKLFKKVYKVDGGAKEVLEIETMVKAVLNGELLLRKEALLRDLTAAGAAHGGDDG